MVKRLFDIVVSGIVLALAAPVLLVGAIAIRLTSPGPIIYRARRVGRNGELFTMHKLRTMHVSQDAQASAITGPEDPRVFFVGSLLRRLKIDELPQLYDVLRGKMSLVGPRPEDPRIVEAHYRPQDRETLRVLPGLAGPGSIYNYTHGDAILAKGDAERMYAEQLLPLKLALEIVYVREASLWYDLRLIFRTLAVMLLIAAGTRDFVDPPELAKARELGLLDRGRPRRSPPRRQRKRARSEL